MLSQGLRYRKQCKNVYGKPDFCFKSKKIAIFWEMKIQKNINRDLEVNNVLTKEGWRALHFWGKEIEKDTQQCFKKILDEYNKTI